MAKKQHGTVTSRAGNERVEQAIPDFQRRFGMAEDQATAVALRLESVGRLQGGGLITHRTTLLATQRIIQAALASSFVRRKSVQVDSGMESEDLSTLRRAARRRNRRR